MSAAEARRGSPSPPLGTCPAGWDCHVHVFDAARPVLAGHYRPSHRPLSEIETLAAALAVGHLVLVQPSVYGTDNSLLIDALKIEPGRHRGVVVLDEFVEDDELQRMHAVGVRGARLNRVSPVGAAGGTDEIDRRFARLAPRLLARGWHLQWYARPDQLAAIALLHAGSGLTCVLDHLAGVHAGIDDGDPAWAALATLAAQGAWIKLSGWYRLQADQPYDAMIAPIRRVAGLFGDRLIWGSDWPHTSYEGRVFTYPSLWAPVVSALGEAHAVALRDRLPAIYA